jgi:hypothetical protein
VSWSEQLDCASKRTPEYQMVMNVGDEEAEKRQAIMMGYLPSTS